MTETESMVIPKLKARFDDKILASFVHCGDEVVKLRKDAIVEVCQFLKEDPELDFNFLMDLCGVDYLGQEPRFEVVYNLYSLRYRRRLRIRVPVPESDPEVETLVSLWPGANWFEREVWDMFGIKFQGHPNLKRILMYEEFVGHPLRKDYPITKRQPLIGPQN